MIISPFAGLLPQPSLIKQIVAPPYDIISRAQAKSLGQHNPYSFVHLSRPEIDVADSVAETDLSVYQQSKLNFDNFLQHHYLLHESRACYYIYQIKNATHCQTGLACSVNGHAINTGHLKKHEHTQPNKVADRIALTRANQAQISPVLLSASYPPTCDELLKQITATTEPLYSVAFNDGYQHSIWQIADQQQLSLLSQQFNDNQILYIADGHHRSACAIELNRLEPQRYPAQILAVIFPHQQLQILGYHRVLKAPLNSTTKIMSQLAVNFQITPISTPVSPQRKGEYGLYHQHQWYQLQFKHDLNSYTVIEKLDTNIIQNFIIEPIFNINDVRNDRRIDFIGGTQALANIEYVVDRGEMDYAITLPATTIQEILVVADNGMVMPPKSTWFNPKLLDGFFVYPY